MNELRIDFHLHTWYSRDGIDPPDLMLRAAAAKQLYAIAITDHNTVRGLKRAKEHKSSVLVIPGIEVDAKEGHIIGLGVSSEIRPWLTAVETIESIKDAGGIVLLPHPYDYIRRGVGGMAKWLQVDAIEVFNAKINTPFSNALAGRLAKTKDCSITAGSDAHLAENVGDAHVIIEERGEPSVDSILSMLSSQNNHHMRISGRITSLRSRVRKIALLRTKRKNIQ
jgi:hypothetical protein